MVISSARHRLEIHRCPAQCPAVSPYDARYLPPLCPDKSYPSLGRPLRSPQSALPDLHCSYWLMRQTKSLVTPRVFLCPVFAGCYESLLVDGPSRRYLLHPCTGAWTLTPRLPFGAFSRFFPKGSGLTLGRRGSARQRPAAMQLPRRNHFEAAVIPLCSGSRTR